MGAVESANGVLATKWDEKERSHTAEQRAIEEGVKVAREKEGKEGTKL